VFRPGCRSRGAGSRSGHSPGPGLASRTGAADRVGLGRHQRVHECGQHRAQQVRRRRPSLVGRPYGSQAVSSASGTTSAGQHGTRPPQHADGELTRSR
jgi:hypothetical protein